MNLTEIIREWNLWKWNANWLWKLYKCLTYSITNGLQTRTKHKKHRKSKIEMEIGMEQCNKNELMQNLQFTIWN